MLAKNRQVDKALAVNTSIMPLVAANQAKTPMLMNMQIRLAIAQPRVIF